MSGRNTSAAPVTATSRGTIIHHVGHSRVGRGVLTGGPDPVHDRREDECPQTPDEQHLAELRTILSASALSRHEFERIRTLYDEFRLDRPVGFRPVERFCWSGDAEPTDGTRRSACAARAPHPAARQMPPKITGKVVLLPVWGRTAVVVEAGAVVGTTTVLPSC